MDSNAELEAFAAAFAAERDEYLSKHERKPSPTKRRNASPELPHKKPTSADAPKSEGRTSVKRKKKATPPKEKGVYRVHLRVREKRIAVDNVFTYVSNKISRLEAELDARKAAKDAGWNIVSILLDIERLPDS